MTACRSGKVTLTAAEASAIAGKHRRSKGRRAYRCTLCRGYHLAQATKLSRSVLIQRERRRLEDRARERDDLDGKDWDA